MALRPIRSFDLKAFTNASSVYNIGVSGTSTQEKLTNPGNSTFDTWESVVNTVYWDNRDLIVSAYSAAVQGYVGWFDPLFVAQEGPKTKMVLTTSANPRGWVMGEWDKLAGTQKIYTWAGGDGSTIVEVSDQISWNFTWTAPTVFTNVRDNGTSGISSGTVGYVDDNSGTEASQYARVFETWGYMLRAGRCRHTDGNLYTGLVLHDITTGGTNPPPGQPTGTPGLATLIPNGITKYSASPSNPVDGTVFEAVAFQGDEIDFPGLQFIPDEDDTPQQPKGSVMLYSLYYDNTAVVAGQYYRYVKFLDFNPFGKSALPGSPSRVHMRETLFSRVEVLHDEAPGTNTNSCGRTNELIGELIPKTQPMVYTPNTRSLATIFDWVAQDDSPGPNDSVVVEHATSPIVVRLDPPTNLTTIETAKTCTWSARASGSIGEGVPNKTMTWTLQRVSTDREALDTSAGASPSGATTTVANAPIDANTLVVEYSADGGGTFITLVEGASNDYTVTESTGVITWEVGITGASPAGPAITGYYASYKHETNPATPAHGTLLQAASTTDNSGMAQTRVRYADDDALAGEYDRVDVTLVET